MYVLILVLLGCHQSSISILHVTMTYKISFMMYTILSAVSPPYSGVSGSSLHTAVLSGQGDMLVFAGDMATDCFTSRLLVYHTRESWGSCSSQQAGWQTYSCDPALPTCTVLPLEQRKRRFFYE